MQHILTSKQKIFSLCSDTEKNLFPVVLGCKNKPFYYIYTERVRDIYMEEFNNINYRKYLRWHIVAIVAWDTCINPPKIISRTQELLSL